MAALVESLFSVRETPWHGMGRILENAPTSRDAIVAAGLDWEVCQAEISVLGMDKAIPDYYANVRSSDNAVLGIVGSRYSIVQNTEAFSFTDSLIGEGCVYETAGSLKGGKVIWLLARLPEEIQIADDNIVPYLCFTNTHDGSGAVKVCSTPIRVVCNNTLNLALHNAKRTWSVRHVGNIEGKLAEAAETLQLANAYLTELKVESERLALQKFDTDTLIKVIDALIPTPDDMTGRKRENLVAVKNDIFYRYTYAPDLRNMEQSALRFIHAVADTATHMEPRRRTANYRENLMINTVGGNDLLDKAYAIVLAA